MTCRRYAVVRMLRGDYGPGERPGPILARCWTQRGARREAARWGARFSVQVTKLAVLAATLVALVGCGDSADRPSDRFPQPGGTHEVKSACDEFGNRIYWISQSGEPFAVVGGSCG